MHLPQTSRTGTVPAPRTGQAPPAAARTPAAPSRRAPLPALRTAAAEGRRLRGEPGGQRGGPEARQPERLQDVPHGQDVAQDVVHQPGRRPGHERGGRLGAGVHGKGSQGTFLDILGPEIFFPMGCVKLGN